MFRTIIPYSILNSKTDPAQLHILHSATHYRKKNKNSKSSIYTLIYRMIYYIYKINTKRHSYLYNRTHILRKSAPETHHCLRPYSRT